MSASSPGADGRNGAPVSVCSPGRPSDNKWASGSGRLRRPPTQPAYDVPAVDKVLARPVVAGYLNVFGGPVRRPWNVIRNALNEGTQLARRDVLTKPGSEAGLLEVSTRQGEDGSDDLFLKRFNTEAV